MARIDLRCALALLLSGLLYSPAPAQEAKADSKDIFKSSPKVLAAFQTVVARPALSTVRVLCEGKDVALGTIVGAEGWILTKYSELKSNPVCRLKDGRELTADLIGVHADHDLALLKIAAQGLTPAAWTESKVCPVGNWVASAGIGADPVAVGVVSVAARPLGGRNTGPAPSPTSGYLGVSIDPEQAGVKVNQVLPKTAAEKAGVKVNDQILAVNNQKVENAEGFMNLLQRHKPDEVITLKIQRGDQAVELKATLGKRPAASRGDFQNSLGSILSDRRTGFPTILQHDQVLKPTDCGGPLCDLEGRVIGINIARAGRTETYAVPAEVVLPLLPDLMAGKLPPPAVKIDPALLDRLTAAKAALLKAEADKATADKKLAEARAALEKLQSEQPKKEAVRK